MNKNQTSKTTPNPFQPQDANYRHNHSRPPAVTVPTNVCCLRHFLLHNRATHWTQFSRRLTVMIWPNKFSLEITKTILTGKWASWDTTLSSLSYICLWARTSLSTGLRSQIKSMLIKRSASVSWSTVRNQVQLSNLKSLSHLPWLRWLNQKISSSTARTTSRD